MRVRFFPSSQYRQKNPLATLNATSRRQRRGGSPSPELWYGLRCRRRGRSRSSRRSPPSLRLSGDGDRLEPFRVGEGDRRLEELSPLPPPPSDERSFLMTGTYRFSGRPFAPFLPLLPSSKISLSFAPIPSKAGRACGSHGSTSPLFFLLAACPSFQPIPRRSAAPNCETGTRS